MGGNAILGTRRILTAEFSEIIKQLIPLLSTVYRHVYVPRFLDEKESHGDIDFVTCLPIATQNVQDTVKELLGSDVIVANGPTVSYLYKGAQIDIHTCQPDMFIMTCWYRDYGDISQLIGLMAKKIGLIYGQNGLHYRLIFANGSSQIIELSRDPAKIFEFFGFDLDQFGKGLSTVGQLIDFLVKSPYFSRDIIDYGKDLTKYEKRPMYLKIRQQILDRPLESPISNRDYIYQRAIDYFKQNDMIAYLKYSNQKDIDYKTRFDSKIVRQLSGLDQRPLGDLMMSLRNTYTRDQILAMNDSEWIQSLDDSIKTYLKNHSD
jgi:hypothetical protein